MKVGGGGLAGAAIITVLTVVSAGCGQSRPASVDMGNGASASCVACHGDPARLPGSIAAAPPVDTRGSTATSSPGVGAHQRHLTGGSVRHAIACDECHRVPTTSDHALHPLDLTWGPLASSRGASPSFDPTSLTCANYCHGSASGGGSVAAPVWNRVDGTQAACGACHGLPPSTAHPAVTGGVTACARCHAGTVNPDGAIDLAGGLHVNGIVELSGSGSCTACHGDPNRQPASIAAAPPTDASGNTSPTAAGVGAHQRHLLGGTTRGPIACAECHAVPADLAHATEPLDLTWGPLARADGALPTWSGTALTCANYCHGATMAGGTLTAPVWNRVDGTQAACGACHGLPPASPHPVVPGGVTGCVGCHAGTVNADGTIQVAGGLHVNGTVDIAGGGAGSCTACHGDASRPVAIAAAPPVDTRGNTATTAAGVGSHQRHLVGGAMRGPLACSECHTVPTNLDHASQPLDLTWGALARSGGAVPSFNQSSLTCANYCHGATIPGGALTSPTWNRVDGTQASCGACHGLPPASPHPAVPGGVTACSACHAGTVNPDGTIKVSGGLHVNGAVDKAFGSGGNCTTCHGDAARPGLAGIAPPVDAHGNTAASARGVGAHQRHLLGGAVHGPISCMECHPFPTDNSHAAQPVQFRWGPLASAGGSSPSYDATRLTCANYCHGATSSGGAITAPVWNKVDGTQAACGTCHGVPPPAPHPLVPSGLAGCAGCHDGTVNPDGSIKLSGGLHLNGAVELSGGAGSCTGCHGDASRSPAAIAPAPPTDTRGNTATTSAGVGAHQRHLLGGSLRGPLACTECHVLPTDIAHASQPLQLSWGALARTNGASPSFNPTALTCSNYCHGSTMPAGLLSAPVWNQVDGTQAACGTCHGVPPAAPHPRVSASVTGCADCHSSTVRPDGTVDVAGGKHVNGAVEITGTGGCTGCHGDPARLPAAIAPAPPADTRGNVGTTAAGVGAHQRHLVGGALRGAIACTECHAIPGDLAHASQPLQLTWGPLAQANGASASFDPTALTCGNYCHGSAGSVPAPVWNRVNGTQAVCGACHGLPPAAPHPVVSGLTSCAGCHAGTVRPDGSIDVAGGLHVNGLVELSGSGGSCTGCHGDPARTPVAIAPAPPRDTKGNVATTAAGVGAHQRHLIGGSVRGPLACSDCHAVPTDITHASHPLQLTWGALARTGGGTPTFDAVALTCANYCHGATLSSGSITAPVWNRADGSQAACGTCHGLPPGGAHPRVGASPSGCASCHPATVNPDGSINLAGGKHVDGLLQVTGHGNYTSPAVHGPAFLDALGVNPATPSCTGCHGLSYDGIGTAPSCNACHAAAGWATSWQSNCSFCHGARNASTQAGYAVLQHPAWSAPPDDVGGRLGGTNSAARTGAHQSHLTGVMTGGGSIAAPFACETCHAVPTDLSHVDGAAARAVVALSSAGQAGLPAVLGSYDPASGNCTTYCHGATLSGGSVAAPKWSITDGTQAACGACHGLPPPFPHPSVTGGVPACAGCHAGTTNPNGSINVAGGLHLNGAVEVAGTGGCTGCHGDPARSPESIASAPPLDTRGNTATAAAGVGAHQRHLTGGVVRGPFPCTECHVVPGDLAHVSQPLQLTWGPLPRADGASPSWNGTALTCANYCHGSTLAGGTLTSPVWNRVDGTQAVCGSCHGLPPASPHPLVAGGVTACSGCHAGTVNPDGSINVAGGLHVNGAVEVAGAGGCAGCHGDPSRTPAAIASAPPKDTKGNVVTTAGGVGAHQSHLVAGSVRGPIPCTECHVVPGDLAHATLPLQLTWGPIATAGGMSPTFNTTSLSCTNYCHGTSAVGGSVPQPLWNRVDGTQAACGACHGLPPPAPHPTVTGGLTACSGCHGGTVKVDGSLDVAGGLHVDGRLQVTGGHGNFSSPATHGLMFFDYLRGSGINCKSCHGQDFGGGGAPSCNACHLSNGWTASWQTNCSFCHGTRDTFTKTTPYSVTAQPTLSAPPDALSQRLTGLADPSRTGAHQAHLTGRGSTSGSVYSAPIQCATCHTVPADYVHAGGTGRAPVTLRGAGGLPANLGTYSQSSATCTTYCHGSAVPAWTGSELSCSGCHGYPPTSGMHGLHVTDMGWWCADCHSGSVDYDGRIFASHLNGVPDVQYYSPGSTWDGSNCTSTCHESGSVRSWQ